jgi:hypothetical protein
MNKIKSIFLIFYTFVLLYIVLSLLCFFMRVISQIHVKIQTRSKLKWDCEKYITFSLKYRHKKKFRSFIFGGNISLERVFKDFFDKKACAFCVALVMDAIYSHFMFALNSTTISRIIKQIQVKIQRYFFLIKSMCIYCRTSNEQL